MQAIVLCQERCAHSRGDQVMDATSVQVGGALLMAVVGGTTAGQYPVKRRDMRRTDFFRWRSQRFTWLVFLGAFCCFLPEVWHMGTAFVTGLLGK